MIRYATQVAWIWDVDTEAMSWSFHGLHGMS